MTKARKSAEKIAYEQFARRSYGEHSTLLGSCVDNVQDLGFKEDGPDFYTRVMAMFDNELDSGQYCTDECTHPARS